MKSQWQAAEWNQVGRESVSDGRLHSSHSPLTLRSCHRDGFVFSFELSSCCDFSQSKFMTSHQCSLVVFSGWGQTFKINLKSRCMSANVITSLCFSVGVYEITTAGFCLYLFVAQLTSQEQSCFFAACVHTCLILLDQNKSAELINTVAELIRNWWLLIMEEMSIQSPNNVNISLF